VQPSRDRNRDHDGAHVQRASGQAPALRTSATDDGDPGGGRRAGGAGIVRKTQVNNGHSKTGPDQRRNAPTWHDARIHSGVRFLPAPRKVPSTRGNAGSGRNDRSPVHYLTDQRTDPGRILSELLATARWRRRILPARSPRVGCEPFLMCTSCSSWLLRRAQGTPRSPTSGPPRSVRRVALGCISPCSSDIY
jgi:hypothetical protein